MADDLGTAVLRITVNDEAARESLRLLRQDIQRSTRVGGAGGRAQGGARESIRALEQAQERRFRLAQRIERLENRGANVSRLRARLGEATTAQANREFEKQRRISVELNRQVRLAEARLQRERQLDTALTRQARIGGARESVRGRVGLTGSPADLAFLARQGGPRLPIRGGADIPGSPAFLAAELSRSARLGGARSPIGGAVGIPGSPAAIRAEERLAAARQRAAQAAEKASQAEGRRIGRLNASPIRGGAAFPGSPEFLRAALPALPSGFFANQRRALDAAARAGGPRSPIGGGIGFPGSPGFFPAALPALPSSYFANQRRQLAAAARRRQDIASNALIGGAFPLLFGQGIGAAVGGGLGGAGGGAIGGQFGFGLSLLGTAVGAQFDAIIQKAGTLSKALNDPINSFGEVTQAGLLSSKGLERQVQALIAVGREAEAAALIQQDLANSYGGAEAARALAESQDQLNRSWTQLSVNLGQLALPVFAAAADDAASSLGGLLVILRSIANLRLPEAPPQGPSASTLARGGLRGLAAFAGGGPVGFLGALGGEVSRFFGRNRPAAATSTEATAAAESKRSSLLSNQYKLITAQVQGYKDLALRAERQISLEQEALDIANLRARRAGDPAVDERRRQGSQERFRIDEELRNLERDRARTAQENERRSAEESAKRASTLRLISSETEIQAGAIERQLQNAQALAQVEAGILRDALAQRQAIEESTASAVERERALRAELGEAQALGDETAIFRATTQLYLAAGQTKLALIDGARALSDSGRSLRDNILNAQRSIRSTLEGSFDLLRAPIQQQLLEQARGRINFSLFDVGRVRTPSEIFGAAAASESIAAQQQTIAQSNTALIDVNSALVKVLGRLADKKWDVAVNVLGASGAQVIGDVVGATS